MKHRGTKILSLLLSLVLVLGLMPGMSAFAETLTWTSGATTVTYKDDDFPVTLTVSGTGAMAGYARVYEVPWRSYRTAIQSVVIHGGVTSIGERAFYNFTNMISVSIPSSVTSIDAYAFYGCYSLPSVVIPNGVTSIGEAAFNRCTGLNGTNLNIPGSVTSIGKDAFRGVNFTSVTFEPGVNGATLTIGDGAFYHSNNSTRLAYGSGNAKLYYENGNEVLEQTLMSTLSNKTLTWKSAGYTVTLSGGANAATSGGATTQSVTPGQAMTTVTYTANSGYTFPAFSNSTTNGVTLTRASDTVVTVSGTPTATTSITVPNAVAVTANAYTVTYAANNGSGDTQVYGPYDAGTTYTVEGCSFAAPEGKVFDCWLGSDGNTYKVGAPVVLTADLTLTAQWKDTAPAPVPEAPQSIGPDIVFIGGAEDTWEYVGGPQHAWKASLAPMVNGSATLVLTTGEGGSEMNIYPQTSIRVIPNPDPGYTLDTIIWSLIDGSASYDITEAQTFVMPAVDVVVYVTFKPVG